MAKPLRRVINCSLLSCSPLKWRDSHRKWGLGIAVGLLWILLLPMGALSVGQQSCFAQQGFNEIKDEQGRYTVSWFKLFDAGVGQSWIPLLVQVKNTSNQDLQLELNVGWTDGQLGTGLHFQSKKNVSWRVSLSAGGTKRKVVPCYVGDEELYAIFLSCTAGDSSNTLSDRIQVQRRGLQQRASWTQTAGQFLGSNVLVIGEASRRIELLKLKESYRKGVEDMDRLTSRYGRKPINWSVLDLQSLPTSPEAYEAVDRFILVGVEPQDFGSKVQREAFLTALRFGKIAWLLPGDSGEGYSWVFDRSQLIVKEANREQGGVVFDLIKAGGQAYEVPLPFRGFSAVEQVKVFAEGQGQWQVLEHSGKVDWVPNLWNQDYNAYMSPADNDHDPNLTANMAGLSPLSMSWMKQVDSKHRQTVPILMVFALIVGYLLTIGPLLFWLLRRKKRLIWLIWLQPSIVVVFLGITWGVGFVYFGTFEQSYQTLVLYHQKDSPWVTGHSMLTRYNPSKGVVDIRNRDNSLSLISSFGGRQSDMTWVMDQNSQRLSNLLLPEWSYTHFLSTGVLDLKGQVHIEKLYDSSEKLSNLSPRMTWKITNDLPFTLRNPVVSLDSTTRKLGFMGIEIPPRATVHIVAEDGISAQRSLAAKVITADDGSEIVFEFDPFQLPEPVSFEVDCKYKERRGLLSVKVAR